MKPPFAYVFALLVSMLVGAMAGWITLYSLGRRFALRDQLQHADAIVSLAGTVGNLAFLDSKIATAVRLYRENWAPIILFSGRFSHMATDTPRLMPKAELMAAVHAGRIDSKTAIDAADSWDIDLDAEYMRQRAIEVGIPPDAILTESRSLNTYENAAFTVSLLADRGARRVILVTSPFHQLRSYLTFAKVYHERGIDVINYYANTSIWRPWTWFFFASNRTLLRGEAARIRTYRSKGDLL